MTIKVTTEVTSEVKSEVKYEVKSEVKSEVTSEVTSEVRLPFLKHCQNFLIFFIASKIILPCFINLNIFINARFNLFGPINFIKDYYSLPLPMKAFCPPKNSMSLQKWQIHFNCHFNW